MNEGEGSGTAAFEDYLEALVGVIGHADRAEPLRDYCLGLMMPLARKSVEPLAALTAPARVSAKHQSLLHLMGQSPWSDERAGQADAVDRRRNPTGWSGNPLCPDAAVLKLPLHQQTARILTLWLSLATTAETIERGCFELGISGRLRPM